MATPLLLSLWLSACAADDPVASSVDAPDPGPRTEVTGELHVALSGQDSDACGDDANPCRTIRFAMAKADYGNRILVHAGTYEERWIEFRSGVEMISADGPLAARISSGDRSAVRFTDGVSNCRLEGFEIFGDWNQGPEGDGLVRIHDASDIVIWGCVLRDAPFDSDVVKISGEVDGVLLRSCVIYNPAMRVRSANPCGDADWFQENVDVFGRAREDGSPGVRNVTLRNCWLFHTPDKGGDWLVYSKISCENILYENNVFGPSAGEGCENPAVGIGTGEDSLPSPGEWVVRHAIVRNNLFVGCKGAAALGILNSDDVWVYNNTFWNNSGPELQAVVELRGNTRPLGEVRILNNLFVGNRPEAPYATFYWVRDGLPAGFTKDHNLYYDNITTSGTPVTGEPNGIYDLDPRLSDPRFPELDRIDPARVEEIARGFVIGAGSPARDAGMAPTGSGHPNWDPGRTDRAWDIFCRHRTDGAWDIGAHERLGP